MSSTLVYYTLKWTILILKSNLQLWWFTTFYFAATIAIIFCIMLYSPPNQALLTRSIISSKVDPFMHLPTKNYIYLESDYINYRSYRVSNHRNPVCKAVCYQLSYPAWVLWWSIGNLKLQKKRNNLGYNCKVHFTPTCTIHKTGKNHSCFWLS